MIDHLAPVPYLGVFHEGGASSDAFELSESCLPEPSPDTRFDCAPDTTLGMKMVVRFLDEARRLRHQHLFGPLRPPRQPVGLPERDEDADAAEWADRGDGAHAAAGHRGDSRRSDGMDLDARAPGPSGGWRRSRRRC
jgi:hypothetical protein